MEGPRYPESMASAAPRDALPAITGEQQPLSLEQLSDFCMALCGDYPDDANNFLYVYGRVREGIMSPSTAELIFRSMAITIEGQRRTSSAE